MRTILLALLLAAAASPGLARDEGEGLRPNRGQAVQNDDSPPPRARSGRSDDGVFGAVRERAMQRRQAGSAGEGAPEPQSGLRGGGASSSAGSGWRPRERVIRTIPETNPNLSTPQPGSEAARHFEGRVRRDYRDGHYTRWSRDWHRDGRYDWRRWRDRHRSRFHLGFYWDPFGWSYRRWNIGWYLWPSHYHSRYWLHDPWYYRLPPAYGPYRWVRYWNDALLVNVHTGEVVDVIHNFFW